MSFSLTGFSYQEDLATTPKHRMKPMLVESGAKSGLLFEIKLIEETVRVLSVFVEIKSKCRYRDN